MLLENSTQSMWNRTGKQNRALLDGSLLRTDVLVFSNSVLCVGGHNAFANEAWATEISDINEPREFEDKYDLAGPPTQFH